MLWKIDHYSDEVSFFFHTDDQAKLAESRGLKDDFGSAYLRLFKRYDQFGYMDESKLSVHFDSKPNYKAYLDSFDYGGSRC